MISPVAIRLEACSLCQLRCTLCPRHLGETDRIIGKGYLRLENFARILDQNPQIRQVELGNFGEVFLNPELPQILEFAHARQVITAIDEGTNLNDASEEALEALVQFQTAKVRCAIDGVTQQTYSSYRVGGNLSKVLRNIQKINAFKERYSSARPRLIFQFVIFSHNEHEIERAQLLARMLNMEICFKLNFYPNSLPVQHRQRIRQLVGYADRTEYLAREHKHYMRHQCYEMWNSPQINWDGKLLGCSRNFWGTYADNVFAADLLSSLNNEKISYAREMLQGKTPLREDLPCRQCGVYQSMRKYGNWITAEELKS